MDERELVIPGISTSPFQGKIPARLQDIVLEYRLKVVYSDRKCLILESPIPGRYLKYVVDPGTHEPLDSWLQDVVRRGLRNQKAVSDVPGAQRVFRDEFYKDIPGLFELEFVEGTPLSAYTESDSIHRLTPEEIEFVGLSTHGTVSTINDRGIMHRDVKPGNIILLTPYLATKLIDWSLAADIQEHETELARGRMLGTLPFYRSDNDAFGVRDRYGLGLTLLQAAASTDERYALERVLEERSPFERHRNILGWTGYTLGQVKGQVPRGLYELMDSLLHPERHEPALRYAPYGFATRDTAVERPAARRTHEHGIEEQVNPILSDSSVSR